MSVSPVQTPPTDLQRFLRAAQQQREAARDGQGASATGSGTTASDIAKPSPPISKDVAKVVADLNALLIAQQSNTPGTVTSATAAQASATQASAAQSGVPSSLADDLGTLLGDAKRAGSHQRHPNPPPDASTADPSATGSPNAAASLAQTLTKALQAYAKQGQGTSEPALATA